MRQIFLMLLLTVALFSGFFPATVQTSISAVENNNITLQNALPVNGMSAVIVRNYGKQLEAITARLVQTSSSGSAKFIDTDVIHHDELPTIKTPVASGDKIIGGYLYDNVLLLAPDADTYARIIKSYEKRWIHPDLYAIFLAEEGDSIPSKENLAAFAKTHQVGLIYIVRKSSTILLDPISGKIVGEKTSNNLPRQAQYPFYMRFDEIDAGWFSRSDKGDYYKTMEAI